MAAEGCALTALARLVVRKSGCSQLTSTAVCLSLAEEIRRAILRPVNLRSPSVAAPPCHPGPAGLRRRFQARNPRFLAAMRESGQRVHRRAAHILIPIGQKVSRRGRCSSVS